VDRLKTAFVHQFAAKGGASFLGKALPFGIGAVIGGAGNNILGRRVLVNSRRAFGIPPLALPPDLEPRPGAVPLERATSWRIRRAGGAIAGGVSRGASAVGGAGRAVGRSVDFRRRRRAIESGDSSEADSPESDDRPEEG
jgi:hypothetical protein